MKTYLSIALLLASHMLFHSAYAQNPKVVNNYTRWAKTVSGVSDVEGRQIWMNPQGSSYTMGQFTGTIDLDPGVGTLMRSSAGDEDIFLQKLNYDGDLVWGLTFGGSLLDDGTGLIGDANGNLYLCGGFEGTVDFDPGAGVQNVTSAADADIFVMKIDSTGQFQWVTTIPGGQNEYAEDIALDPWGNIYVVGNFEGTVDFDPGPGMASLSSGGGYDIFVLRMDAMGGLIWANSFAGAGTSIEEGYSISTDTLGNVYTAGGYLDAVDFNPGAGVEMAISRGGNDIFLQKMDSAGAFQWVRSYGGMGEDYAYGLDVDVDGNSHLAGGFTDSIVLDSAGMYIVGAGDADALMMKVAPNGNTEWWDKVGGPGFDVAKCVKVQDDFFDSFPHFAGEFSGTANLAGRNDFPRQYTSNGDLDVFLLGFYPGGTMINNAAFGGPGEDGVSDMSARWAGYPFMTGKFSDSADFDMSVQAAYQTSQGGFDSYTMGGVIILNSDPPRAKLLRVYPNPTTGGIKADASEIGQEGSWTLWEIQGKVMEQGKYSGGKFDVQLEKRPPGMYLLRVESEDGEAHLKVVRQ